MPNWDSSKNTKLVDHEGLKLIAIKPAYAGKRCGSIGCSTYPNFSGIETEDTNYLCPQILSWAQSLNAHSFLAGQSSASTAIIQSTPSAPSYNNRRPMMLLFPWLAIHPVAFLLFPSQSALLEQPHKHKPSPGSP
jgi:hypothetical protein